MANPSTTSTDSTETSMDSIESLPKSQPPSDENVDSIESLPKSQPPSDENVVRNRKLEFSDFFEDGTASSLGTQGCYRISAEADEILSCLGLEGEKSTSCVQEYYREADSTNRRRLQYYREADSTSSTSSTSSSSPPPPQYRSFSIRARPRREQDNDRSSFTKRQTPLSNGSPAGSSSDEMEVRPTSGGDPMKYLFLSTLLEDVILNCSRPECSARINATNQPEPAVQVPPPTSPPVVSSPDTDSEIETSSNSDEGRTGDSRKRKRKARTATGRNRRRPRPPKEK